MIISCKWLWDIIRIRGNITSEKRGDLTTTCQYDALGQLIRMRMRPGFTTTTVAATSLPRSGYAYATGTAVETIPYTYVECNWKDKIVIPVRSHLEANAGTDSTGGTVLSIERSGLKLKARIFRGDRDATAETNAGRNL